MKITVIGASAPGLFAAYLLAKHGFEVEVCELSAVIGTPRRTLIVTRGISDVLGFHPEGCIINEIKYVEIFTKSSSVKLKLKEPDLVIERSKLICLLAKMAECAGAKIKIGRRFLGFAAVSNKLCLSIKNLTTGESEYLSTDLLIGADGGFSSVSRAAGCDGYGRAALLQARVPLPVDMTRDTVRVWFEVHSTKYFYWLVPESHQMAAAGLIDDNMRKAHNNLQRFLSKHALQPREFQAAMIPRHRFEYSPRVVAPARKVYLLGDAAGQVKSTTVGGVVPGLRGAMVLVHAITRPRNCRREMNRLKLELDLHLFLRMMLRCFDDEDYDTLVDMLDGKLRKLLEEKTRDELANSILGLIVAEPRLLRLGGKALLKRLAFGG